MGLSFGTLVNAALGGSAAYMGGKREGQSRAAKAAQDEEYNLSRIQENAAQAASARAAAALAQDKLDHPEKHMAAKTPPRQQQWEAEQEFYNGLVKGGAKPGDARKATDIQFGHNEPRDQGPVRGTPEYFDSVRKEAEIHGQIGAKYRAPAARDTGEAGSAKDATDRREFLQNRIAKHIDEGDEPGVAQQKAETEYAGARRSAQKLAPGYVPESTTAKSLARSIPPGPTTPPPGYYAEPGKPGVFRPLSKSSSSANAGTRGVKPTETSSTQKTNPLNANSPRVGALKEPDDAALARAQAEVGGDEHKVLKWLHDHGYETYQ